ncbi:MAG: hypothetical protein IKI35_03055, partial [Stomatobaculum sp.]|nr:hypothetical protein [Stomatobaculum sp.]
EEAVSDWASGGIERTILGSTLNNMQRAQLNLDEEDDDKSILDALLGQAPWTEEGVVTLLSTLIMGGTNSLIQDNVITVPKEQAEEILAIAKSAGNKQLAELAEEYSRVLDRRGSLGAEKYRTIYEATEERLGEDELRNRLQLGAQEQARAYQDEQDALQQAGQAREEAEALQRQAEGRQRQAAAYQDEQTTLQQAAQERADAAEEAERVAAAARAAEDYQAEETALLEARQAREEAERLQQQAEEAQRQADAYQQEQTEILQQAQARQQAAEEAEGRARAARAFQDEQTALRQGQTEIQAEGQRQTAAARLGSLVPGETEREQGKRYDQMTGEEQKAAWDKVYADIRNGQQNSGGAGGENLTLPQTPGAQTSGPLISREGEAEAAGTEERTTATGSTTNTTGGNGNVQENQQGTAQTQPGLLGQEETQPAADQQPGRAGATDISGADTATGTAAAVSTAGQTVPDGSGRRIPGGRSGGTDGRVDGNAGTGSGVTAGGRREAGRPDRPGYADALRRSGARQVSSNEMGVRNGTDTPTFYVIPQEMWSDDLKKIARRLKMTTDCDVTFIAGNMQVSQDGRNFRIRGYYDQANKQIVVQADHGSYSAEQIAKHEEFHARQSRDPGLLREIVERIDRRYGPDELRWSSPSTTSCCTASTLRTPTARPTCMSGRSGSPRKSWPTPMPR